VTGDGAGRARVLLRTAARTVRAVLRSVRPGRPGRTGGTGHPGPSAGTAIGYAGDAVDVPELQYTPRADDQADPGEIVWAWVPFEEDHTRGKDRPVLVVGRRDGLLLALMLTSKDHDRDAADEARHGRHWIDIGTGEWDQQHRPSEVRVDRVLQLDPSAVRRGGATLDRERFDQVAAAVRRAHPR